MNEKERMEEFLTGVGQFNRREFFECHETLEHLWTNDRSPERELIQGIIQIAVGYYHYLRSNRVGALKLLTRGLARVKKFQDKTMRLNIRQFALDVESNIHSIETSQVDTFPPITIPIIEVLQD
ncbi:MAG: DUF309 domain-containing protein [Candidatus Obscuribacterales bacterium]|nr:MAG: DUF309 domain-containing protein [Candidatus Melainabacteria bacterium]